MKHTNSLEEQLKNVALETIEYRVKQWAEYYFEKEFLPGLQSEIKERCLITLLNTMEKHGGIQLHIEFKPKVTK